jgi:hypothetical protein
MANYEDDDRLNDTGMGDDMMEDTDRDSTDRLGDTDMDDREDNSAM